MRKRPLAIALLALAAAAGGCTSDAAPDAAQVNEVEARHDVEVVTTMEGDLQLLDGYSYVFDMGSSGKPCVEWAAAPKVQTTGLTTNVSIGYISSLSKLEEQLGIDAALGAKVDPVGEGSLTAKYTHSLTTTDNRYSYLLVAEQRYTVLAAAPVKMAADRPDGADEFLTRCGDSYVKGVTYTASLRLLMDIDAPSREQADQIAAGVTAAASKKLPAVEVSGNASANVTSSTTSTSSQFNIRYALEAKGFDPSTGPMVLPTNDAGTGIADSIAQLAASYLTVLAKSAGDDLKAEVGAQGSNPDRHAVPVEVVRGYYQRVDGFADKANPFPKLNPRIAKARDFMNKLGYLNAQLNDVYYDEIERFRSAEGANKSRYNLVPPATPMPNAVDLVAVAAQQEEVFRPTGGSSQLGGNVTAGVRARIHDCLESAREAGYASCLVKAADLPEYVAALDALDHYAATSRILPLNFYSVGDHVYYHGDCDDAGNGAFGLANATEVAELAPVVAADPKQCAWFDDTAADHCSSWSRPYFTSNSAEPADQIGAGYQCGSSANVFRQCAILCVPPEGPFGTPAVLGRGIVH